MNLCQWTSLWGSAAGDITTDGWKKGGLTGAGVDDGPAAGLGVVGGDKVLDPVHHGAGREAVAGGAAGVVLHVEGTGKGDAIGRPAATVGSKVGGLGGAGAGGGLGKVVGAADEAGVGGTGVLGAEPGALVGGALGGLDVDEAVAGGVGLGEVGRRLPSRDVKAGDGGLGHGGEAGEGGSKGEGLHGQGWMG